MNTITYSGIQLLEWNRLRLRSLVLFLLTTFTYFMYLTYGFKVIPYSVILCVLVFILVNQFYLSWHVRENYGESKWVFNSNCLTLNVKTSLKAYGKLDNLVTSYTVTSDNQLDYQYKFEVKNIKKILYTTDTNTLVLFYDLLNSLDVDVSISKYRSELCNSPYILSLPANYFDVYKDTLMHHTKIPITTSSSTDIIDYSI